MKATTLRNKNATRQDYETPDDFFRAVSKYLPIVWDLAAAEENAKHSQFISPEQNAFTWNWNQLARGVWLWLNPPFKNIQPWVEKCQKEMNLGAQIALLTPASVGSNWFRDYVFQRACIIFLNGRLTFKGEDNPYPKDCMLTLWSKKIAPDIRVWNWRNDSMP